MKKNADNKNVENIATPRKKSRAVFSHVLILLIILLGFAGIQWQLQQLKSVTQTLTQQQNVLSQNINNIKNQRLSWELQEIRYFVTQATVILDVYQNPSEAINLLTKADTKLLALSNAEYSAIHDALQKNITQLTNSNTLNLPDLLKQLQALGTSIKTAPMFAQTLPQQPTANTAATAIQASSTQQTKLAKHLTLWRKFLASTWEQLRKVVIIRRHDLPQTPMLSEQNEVYAEHHMQLLIQQIAWAAINRQQQLYTTSVAALRETADAYFAYNQDAKTATDKAIDELQNIKVDITPINLDEVTQLIDNAIVNLGNNAN